jgi:hypothetical protein
MASHPGRYAIQTGMAESEAIALFLHATRSGLFTMEWQLVCSGCGHLVESLRSVGNLHSHYGCAWCFTENEASLDDSHPRHLYCFARDQKACLS